MVPPLRFELKTLDLADRSSVQLNYGGTNKKGGVCDLAMSLAPPRLSSLTHRSARMYCRLIVDNVKKKLFNVH